MCLETGRKEEKRGFNSPTQLVSQPADVRVLFEKKKQWEGGAKKEKVTKTENELAKFFTPQKAKTNVRFSFALTQSKIQRKSIYIMYDVVVNG